MNISVEYHWFCLLEILPGVSHAGNTKETVLVMVDTMLSYTYVRSLPKGRCITVKLTNTCQGIVTIDQNNNDHAPPCICFFHLILIHSNTVQV